MDKQEATKLISEKIREAEKLISEAENISDQSGVGFSWDMAYGMGGYYQPASDPSWTDSSSCYEDTGGWQASSEMC